MGQLIITTTAEQHKAIQSRLASDNAVPGAPQVADIDELATILFQPQLDALVQSEIVVVKKTLYDAFAVADAATKNQIAVALHIDPSGKPLPVPEPPIEVTPAAKDFPTEPPF